MLGRTLTAGVETAIAASHAIMCHLCEMDFASGFVRVNDSAIDITCAAPGSAAYPGAVLWSGKGKAGKVSAIREGSSLQADSVSFELSGVPLADDVGNSYIVKALAENYQLRPVRLWRAFLNADTYAVIADPVMLFRGRMDTMDAVVEENGARITVNAQNRLAAWNRPRNWRFTAQWLRSRFPDDAGLDFVAQMENRELRWGGQPLPSGPTAQGSINRYQDGSLVDHPDSEGNLVSLTGAWP